MKYQINLVRALRIDEEKARKMRTNMVSLTVLAIVVLGLSAAYAAWDIFAMNMTLREEREKLAKVEAEYRQYKETKEIVTKADIELLDRLYNGKIFWTRKLASMALHLPENYWITSFGYNGSVYNVKGYGYISPRQEQLITVDDYLNMLREDKTFSDVFRTIYINSILRTDEGFRERVSFEYSGEGRK
jgi:Tfp pilus assembly protein PilN